MMGEIAEMMLDGTLCEECGEFIGTDAGFPQYCSPACARGRGMEYEPPTSRRPKPHIRDEQARHLAKKFCCTQCGKRFLYATALAQHERDKHGGPFASDNGTKP